MNDWLILILSAIAMVAILVVFMWWWTTDNWEWASAELKPPRTVRLSLETAAEFELEQRVTALEDWKKTEVGNGYYLLDRLTELDKKLEAATPSPPTENPTTDSPSDALVPGVTIPTDPTSWPSDQQIMDAGLVTRVYESAEE